MGVKTSFHILSLGILIKPLSPKIQVDFEHSVWLFEVLRIGNFKIMVTLEWIDGIAAHVGFHKVRESCLISCNIIDIVLPLVMWYNVTCPKYNIGF